MSPTLPRLSASIVLYESDVELFRQTVDALAVAIAHATDSGVVGDVNVAIVDNGAPGGDAIDDEWDPGVSTRAITPTTRWRRIAGQGNVGFGRGHNLMLLDPDAAGDFHLVLNPDAPLAADALSVGLQWMRDTPDCGLVAPNARTPLDAPLFLCKRYPDAFTLLLRAAAPALVRRWFAGRLARYELHDVVGRNGEAQARDVTLVSGCCMLLRRRALGDDAVRGFDPSFFVYFEDYDLSLRIVRSGRWHIDYVPAMKLVHYGGHAARKSGAHIRMFAAGAMRFFNKHGWKLV